MKFLVTAFVALSVSINSLLACDVCGCGTGSTYLGIDPNYGKTMFNARFQFSQFSHPNTDLNFSQQNRVKSDHFYRTEVWTQWQMKPKWQAKLTLPFARHQRFDMDGVSTIDGIGDVRAQVNYAILNQTDSLNKSNRQLLFIGAELGLPTGKYQQRDRYELKLPAAFQIGKGAFSYQAFARHVLKRQNWGVSSHVQFLYNGENELQYRFGEQTTVATSFFYSKKVKNTLWLPSLGLRWDYYSNDVQYGITKAHTGGHVLNVSAGLDFYFSKWVLNVFGQVPVQQTLSESQPESKSNFGFGLGYYLEARKKAMPDM